jgi:hypothetical protein
MGYEVFVYLVCVAFLTLCASRSPRLCLVRASSRTTAGGPAYATADRRQDLSVRG